MCPMRARDAIGDAERIGQLRLPLDGGSEDSNGPTGEPLPSGLVLGTMVRRHKGRSTIYVTSLTVTEDTPGTFSALKVDDLGGYMVTLSCVMTSSQYAALIQALEKPLFDTGNHVSVGHRFVPTTPNLVPQDTAPST